MMRQDRLYRREGIILRRSDFGEADRLLVIYTKEAGKVRVVAKGVRKPQSRKGGHLELFAHSRLLLARGRSLDIITQAETIEPFMPLRLDLLRTSYAYYLAELVDKFTEEEENPALFALLLASLHRLSEASDLDLLARYFELHLLEATGYRPEFQHCLHCKKEEGSFRFAPAQGGILCQDCAQGRGRPISSDALRHLRLLQAGDYSICQVLDPSPVTRREMEDHLRRLIIYILERNLKSVGFIASLKKPRRAPEPAMAAK